MERRMAATGWKILTHDFRSPIQGGPPLCDGHTWPVTLPTVPLDRGPEECAAGWNFCESIEEGWVVAGMWPAGRSANVVLVAPSKDAIQRGSKGRASGLSLLRLATEGEIDDAMTRFSEQFWPHADAMKRAQLRWLHALARPRRDPAAITSGLLVALESRGLSWTLKRYPTARAARNAWCAWPAWAAGAAWAAGDAVRPWVAWPNRNAWGAWGAGAVGAALDAGDALIIYCARLMGRQGGDPAQYEHGILEACAAGLAVALPTGPGELGWAIQDGQTP